MSIFFCEEKLLILKQVNYRKVHSKDENYKQDPLQLDVAGEEQNVPMARRRRFSTRTLDRKKTPCGREVVEPRTLKSLHPAPSAATPRFTNNISIYSGQIRRQVGTSGGAGGGRRRGGGKEGGKGPGEGADAGGGSSSVYR
jgi:uncharacterized membrane protein YgcG